MRRVSFLIAASRLGPLGLALAVTGVVLPCYGADDVAASAVDEGVLKQGDSIFGAGHGARGDVAVGIGAFFDPLDPRAVAGATVRAPQLAIDARFGLGKGWSALVHLNTLLVVNELNAGASYSFPLMEDLRGVVQLRAGVFAGMLGSVGFDAGVVAPQLRPLVGVSLQDGDLTWSLRGELVFAGPYFASVGEVGTTLATQPPIANYNLMLALEQRLARGHFWYAGLGLMGSTASYQLWLLFPDTARFDHYPRLMAGYEF